MGGFFSRLAQMYSEWGQEPARILMLGLDAAGKTTMLYKLKLNESVTTIPTIGFNVETVEMPNGLSFTVWDIGGQEKLRALWQHYFENSHGLIFIIDSNDPSRFEEAAKEFRSVISDERMRGVPVLIYANKQDLPQSNSPAAIMERLKLADLSGHQWHVQGCCAMTGDGIIEGMNVFAKHVKAFKKQRYH